MSHVASVYLYEQGVIRVRSSTIEGIAWADGWNTAQNREGWGFARTTGCVGTHRCSGEFLSLISFDLRSAFLVYRVHTPAEAVSVLSTSGYSQMIGAIEQI